MISNDARDRIKGAFEPIAIGLGRLGFSPNALTVIGFVFALLAAVAAGRQGWLIAGLLVIGGGVFDLFDGVLARAQGKASAVGAFMDSVFDRAGEAVVYVGIAVGMSAGGRSDAVPLDAAAMAASFMVSYTRSKSEGLGFTAGTGMAAVGLAPREVRIVILTVGLLLTGASGAPFVPVYPPGAVCIDFCSAGSSAALVGSLALITILATITTIQRIVHVLRQASSKEQQ